MAARQEEAIPVRKHPKGFFFSTGQVENQVHCPQEHIMVQFPNNATTIPAIYQHCRSAMGSPSTASMPANS